VGGVPSGADTSSFLEERGETGVRVYQEDVLQGVVQQLNMTLFSGQEWVFQQDSVPAHKPRQLRSGCRGTFWPLSAPRIGPRGVQTSNPRDYKLWAVLEGMSRQKRHNNLYSLKKFLVKAVAEIPLETLRATIAEWPVHLKACVEAEGGHFEWHYYK